MRPSILDEIEPQELNHGSTNETRKSISQKLAEQSPTVEKRHESFPLNSIENKILGEYNMQFPKRFEELWVINPIYELADYPSRFKDSRRIKGKDIKPFLIKKNGVLVPGVPYDWLYDAFMGNPQKNLEPLFTLLKFTNYSGDQDFDYLLVDKIISYGDIHLNDFWLCRHFDNGIILRIFVNKDLPLWLSFLKSQIPTELVSEDIMEKNAPSIIKGLVKRNPNDEKIIENLSEVMETLGCYYSEKNMSKTKILICPNRIRKVAKDLDIDPDILFCIVYVHELAHAAMDQSIDAEEFIINDKEDKYFGDHKYCIKKADNKYTPNDASFFMEESLANLIMLKYFKCYSEIVTVETLFETARRFVSQQAPMYKFGLRQFEINADWTKWREYKSKKKEDEVKLEEWYKKYAEDENLYTLEDFNSLF